MKKPFLIVIDGPMGSGKTTLAKELHKKISSTSLISLDLLKHFVSEYKLDSKKHLDMASKIGRAMTKEYLKNNINVIVEKAFTREEFLKEFIKGFKNKSRLFIYQLHSPLNLRIKRIKERGPSPNTGKIQKLPKIQKNSKHFEEFRYREAKEFDTSKLTVRQMTNKILKDIK